ncbi:inactive TPR repeat-containing thioredoxin TTL3 [Euphorbia lathyris]|uniref:inactive TPR repeat-containing thioredoxin TTL3 n=1 Tax=Euphorbia lathyris TaxID=212925 RepID=UPI00331442AA
MSEASDVSPDKKTAGCGILNAVFGRKGFWPRRSTSVGSLPSIGGGGNNFNKPPTTPKRRRSGSDEGVFLEIGSSISDGPVRPIRNQLKTPHAHAHAQPQQRQQQPNSRKPQEEAAAKNQHAGIRKVPKEAIGISGELESMFVDHLKYKGKNELVRASSGNVMLYGNLGNLRQPGGVTENGKYPNSMMGNVVKKQEESGEEGVSLCRALSTRMDPEQLKMMGNEDYKNGNFVEALALYDAAIAIDPNKSSYRSNKSAALTALGRILEAVFECREAIRIDPHYHRAHHRLANLYLRLGDAEKAMYHYKHAGQEADHVDIAKVKNVQLHLNRCTDARNHGDWHALIKETKATMSSGADSAPQIYALQAEAYLKLYKHQEAEEALKNGPNFNTDDCIKYFGPIGFGNSLAIRARVDMAMGRFEEAVAKAERASRLDPNNREANNVMRKAKAVAAARSNGNHLFKAGKHYEACNAYGEGLEHDHCNSVLLCNRAACRSKLGQFEKAIEDCNAALNVRPTYSKARLRRAHCYAKLEKWEASMQEYEVLQRELPEDEEVRKGLLEAKAQLNKRI